MLAGNLPPYIPKEFSYPFSDLVEFGGEQCIKLGSPSVIKENVGLLIFPNSNFSYLVT